MKDKKLLTAVLLLPVTLLFVGAAVAASLTAAQAAGNVPIAQDAQAETCVEIPIELELSATDTDNDIVLYQLTEQPRLGTAKIEGSTLTYSPDTKTGRDRFRSPQWMRTATQPSLRRSWLQSPKTAPG